MTSSWINRVLLVSGCLSFLRTDVSGEIVNAPRDTEAMVGQMTYFNCSTSFLNDPKEIAWYFFPIGKEDRYIYSRGLFNNFGDRFQVNNDPSTGTIDLIIPSVEERDAGGYECEDEGGLGRHSTRRAQLIVLAGEPVYESNMSSDGVIGPNDCDIELEYFQLSCRIPYLGNIPPNMEWKKVGDNTTITTGVSVEKLSDIVTYKLTMKGDLHLNGSTYVCKTTRSATTTHFNCTSDQVKILFSIKPNVTSTIAVGDRVVCFVDSSQPCKFEWSWLDVNGVLMRSSAETLLPSTVGFYKCEAKCYMRDKPCIIEEVMLVNVTERAIKEDGEPSVSPISIMVAVIVVILVVAAIICVSVLCFFKRKRKRGSSSDFDIDNLSTGYPFIAEDRKKSIRRATLKSAAEPESLSHQVNNESLSGAAEVIGYREDPILINKIETKEAESLTRKSVQGMTILDSELFLIFKFSSDVEVYDSLGFSYIRLWKLKELNNPLDIVSSEGMKWLYVIDGKSRNETADILRIDFNSTPYLRNRWSTGYNLLMGTLSITNLSNVIVILTEFNKILEYSPNGEMMREVNLELKIVCPMHAITLGSDHFVVCYCSYADSLDTPNPECGVCIVDTNGIIVKSFDGIDGQLNRPVHLAIDADGSIMVADRKNRRVLLLSSALELEAGYVRLQSDDFVVVDRQNSRVFSFEYALGFERDVLSAGADGLRYPAKIHLDQSNGRLFVADNLWDEERKIWKHGRVLCWNFREGQPIGDQKGVLKYLEKPTLVGTIETKEAWRKRKAIAAMTILNNELFLIITDNSSVVEVYDCDSLSVEGSLKVSELVAPHDIVGLSCTSYVCLFILDLRYEDEPSKILRVDPNNGQTISKWSTEESDFGDLSVTKELNIILTFFNKNKLIEYSPDGHLIREIKFSSQLGIVHPLHAIQLTSDYYVVCHGDVNDRQHRVCIVDATGNILKSFGGERGPSDEQLDCPVYLAADEEGFIMVADRDNSRVLLLSSTLEFRREILLKEKHGLRYLSAIHLDQSNGRLFVADEGWNEETKEFCDGKILMFNTK